MARAMWPFFMVRMAQNKNMKLEANNSVLFVILGGRGVGDVAKTCSIAAFTRSRKLSTDSFSLRAMGSRQVTSYVMTGPFNRFQMASINVPSHLSYGAYVMIKGETTSAA